MDYGQLEERLPGPPMADHDYKIKFIIGFIIGFITAGGGGLWAAGGAAAGPTDGRP